MGQAYVDDHRFLLYQGSSVRDITEVVGNPQLRDELDALSVEVTFQALRNDKNDPYAHWYGISPGDKLRIVNHGTEIFSGIILTVGQDGSVTANDPGWHLAKSQIILQCSNAPASDAVARMCAKAGIQAGTLDLPPTRISKVWWGDTPETILEDILSICSAETGKTYRRRVRSGRLTVAPLPTAPITLYHRPASNLRAFDVSLTKGSITGTDSMEDLVNSVILTDGSGDGGRVLGRAYNAASIAKYGLLQTVESLSGDENTAQARQRIQNLLAEKDRITKERTIEDLFGTDECESGVLANFVENRYDVGGPLRITSVTHRYGSPHMMSVTVEMSEPRATGGSDTIQV